jgi:hypothetical protein
MGSCYILIDDDITSEKKSYSLYLTNIPHSLFLLLECLPIVAIQAKP